MARREKPSSLLEPSSPPLLLNSVASYNEPAVRRIHPALRGYLCGQLSTACSFGIWWVLSSPIFLSIFSHYGVGLMRLCYNLALFLCSPIAGHLVDRVPVRSVLCGTTLGRALIYALALPALWLVCRSPLLPLHAMPGAELALQQL